METPTKTKGQPQPDSSRSRVGEYPKIFHFFLTKPHNLQSGLFFGGGGSSKWVRSAAASRRASRVFSLEFVTQGVFRFEQDGETGLAAAGDIFLVRYHTDHCMECISETAEKRMLKLDGPMLPLLLRGLHWENANILHPRNPQRIARVYDRIARALRQKKSAFELSLLAVELLFTIAEESAENVLPEQAVKMSEYLEQQLRSTFSLEMMARYFAMSKSTLLRHFARYFNTTPNAYLKRLRLETAQYLLRYETELSIKQIAEQVGYLSPFHFSTEFTSFTGMSPRAYRGEIS
jgi:AraC-like DNA-binding protein